MFIKFIRCSLITATTLDAIAIAIEDAKSPYANLIAVRTQDKDKYKPWVAKLVKAFQSPEVKKLVERSFSGSLVAAF